LILNLYFTLIYKGLQIRLKYHIILDQGILIILLINYFVSFHLGYFGGAFLPELLYLDKIILFDGFIFI